MLRLRWLVCASSSPLPCAVRSSPSKVPCSSRSWSKKQGIKFWSVLSENLYNSFYAIVQQVGLQKLASNWPSCCFSFPILDSLCSRPFPIHRNESSSTKVYDATLVPSQFSRTWFRGLTLLILTISNPDLALYKPSRTLGVITANNSTPNGKNLKHGNPLCEEANKN